MDYKRVTASTTTETRNLADLSERTGNIYETVRILGKRSNQIAVEMKQDLDAKLQEFASYSDNLEEVFENHEQIEISKFYGTPKSRSFVNGLLDRLIQKLTTEGQIVKEGKGLM